MKIDSVFFSMEATAAAAAAAEAAASESSQSCQISLGEGGAKDDAKNGNKLIYWALVFF